MKKFSKFIIYHSSFILFFFVVFTLSPIHYPLSTTFAAPPLDWNYLKTKPKDFKPCRTYSPKAVKKAQAKGVLRKAGVAGVISPTIYKILVIRVDFPGISMTKSKSDTESFFVELQKYFSENSYELLTVSATVTSRNSGGSPGGQGAYRLGNISYYNDESTDALENLRKDAVTAADADYDFSKFDHTMVYHAGYGEEDSKVSTDIWSLYWDPEFSVDGKTFDGFTIVPELSKDGKTPLGVICHEYGHQSGLPDLYDIGNPYVPGDEKSTCGTWSLMDYPYGYDNSGNPPPLDIWGKDFLKFVDLDTRKIIQAGAKIIGDTGTSSTTGYWKIPIEVGTSNEYFVLEYRLSNKINYKNMPGDGILIWHIDDTIARNPSRLTNNTINHAITGPYYSVDLVEKDGSASYPPGQASDAFVTNDTFTKPQSNAFNGNPTGITLWNFSSVGSSAMTFDIGMIEAGESLVLKKYFNYPNPTYTTQTTIRITLTCPPKDLSLEIYNLTGEKVKSVPKTEINLNLGKSTNENWVYEYLWNLENDNGEKISSGIYLYLIKADEEKKVGKLAIIR